MYVKDYMTRNPKTITKDTPVSKALEIMQQGDFHRLPVVDDEGKLIGLITEGLVTESSGKNTTSLSIYELNYLLSRTKVKDIMITEVRSTSADRLLEEAAAEMIESSVSVLPVVDENNHVEGIITERDMFRAFTEIMGYQDQGTKFIIQVEDRPGEMEEVSHLFAEQNANLDSLVVYHNEERGTELVIKATGEIEVEPMTKILEDAKYVVTKIIQTTKEGKVIIWR
ncbi:MAG: CBS domain-containing protein [Solobacterium sp.]|nr:CBS domain-containing protein [Solobacterium sp.]